MKNLLIIYNIIFLLAGNVLFSNIHYIHNHDHWMMPTWLQIASSILLLVILTNSLLRLYFPNMFVGHKNVKSIKADIILTVGGMTCNHCVNSVTNAISEVTNVENIDVNLASGTTKIIGNNIDINEVVKAITSSGYSTEIVK